MVSADREEKKGIKGGVDKDDCRKNRQAQKVELRKAKRDEGLQKRRNMAVVQVDVSDPVDDAATPEKGNASGAAPTFDQNCQTALGFVARGPAEEYDVAFAATRALRKELSLARNPPIDDCINQNMVPAFVTMLGHPEAKLQFEAAWCLTNIASGTSKQCEVVVQNNGVPPLVGLMGSPVARRVRAGRVGDWQRAPATRAGMRDARAAPMAPPLSSSRCVECVCPHAAACAMPLVLGGVPSTPRDRGSPLRSPSPSNPLPPFLIQATASMVPTMGCFATRYGRSRISCAASDERASAGHVSQAIPTLAKLRDR